MKSKTLWLTSGVPASGKTTWVKRNFPNTPYISRDEVRFSLIKDDEDYFAHEDEVFETFVKKIQNSLDTLNECVADATHLSEKSRNKLLDKLSLEGVEIIILSFKVPLETLLERNENRTGRAYVPKSVIRRMFYQFQPATQNEKYKYKDVITIKE
jgi:protein phosphatase